MVQNEGRAFSALRSQLLVHKFLRNREAVLFDSLGREPQVREWETGLEPLRGGMSS
jgi:hypothetical protein